MTFLQPRRDDMSQVLDWKTSSFLFTGLGLAGVDWVRDTTARTGKWWVFHAVTDCVIASVTYANGFSSGTPAGVTVKAGDRIYGPILGFELTSGDGELYRASA